MNSRFIDLVWLWLRNYFKHPVENIRQADPIIPGRLYRNFGNICKAVRYTTEERRFMEEYEAAVLEAARNASQESPSGLNPQFLSGLSHEGLMEIVKSVGGNVESIKALQETLEMNDKPAKCYLCDFEKYGVPCPIYNALKDRRCVCDHYKYIIIKRADNV